MMLEKVQKHKYREDIYINNIIIPHNEINEQEKLLINKILYKELALSS